MNYDRFILDLIDRVTTLEKEVATLKEQRDTKTIANNDLNNDDFTDVDPYLRNPQTKDTTKYLFNGKIYGKNRLVLAVVNAYVENHSSISAENLITTFDKTLQGSLGVVRKLDEVRINCRDYERRFFVQPNEIINTSTGKCVVCTQWGISNIDKFIAKSRKLGFEIDEIK